MVARVTICRRSWGLSSTSGRNSSRPSAAASSMSASRCCQPGAEVSCRSVWKPTRARGWAWYWWKTSGRCPGGTRAQTGSGFGSGLDVSLDGSLRPPAAAFSLVGADVPGPSWDLPMAQPKVEETGPAPSVRPHHPEKAGLVIRRPYVRYYLDRRGDRRRAILCFCEGADGGGRRLGVGRRILGTAPYYQRGRLPYAPGLADVLAEVLRPAGAPDGAWDADRAPWRWVLRTCSVR